VVRGILSIFLIYPMITPVISHSIDTSAFRSARCNINYPHLRMNIAHYCQIEIGAARLSLLFYKAEELKLHLAFGRDDGL
jgi:hypothetical protein